MAPGHIFSENADIEAKNKAKGLLDRTFYIPNASKTNKDIIVHNNKSIVLHTNCMYCNDPLIGRVWKALGICAICDLG